MSKKLAVLLGLRDKTEKTHEQMLTDMLSKFKNKQGIFKGERRTYSAIDSYADDPTKRGFKNVETTVDLQLAWFKKYTKDHFDIVFAIEKTNAAAVTAHLVVEGEDWGEFTTLELLRAKSILDGKMRSMVKEIPIRNEGQIWKKSEDPVFQGGVPIFETPLEKGFSKTTLKQTVIVFDPHADKPGRQPVAAEKSEQVNVGEYTNQSFSGEYTNMQRAILEVKYDKLYTAIVEALENANSIESLQSELGDKILDYLF